MKNKTEFFQNQNLQKIIDQEKKYNENLINVISSLEIYEETDFLNKLLMLLTKLLLSSTALLSNLEKTVENKIEITQVQLSEERQLLIDGLVDNLSNYISFFQETLNDDTNKVENELVSELNLDLPLQCVLMYQETLSHELLNNKNLSLEQKLAYENILKKINTIMQESESKVNLVDISAIRELIGTEKIYNKNLLKFSEILENTIEEIKNSDIQSLLKEIQFKILSLNTSSDQLLKNVATAIDINTVKEKRDELRIERTELLVKYIGTLKEYTPLMKKFTDLYFNKENSTKFEKFNSILKEKKYDTLFNSLLILPIQRVAHYSVLTKEILKEKNNMKEKDLEAINSFDLFIQDTLNGLNETMKKYDEDSQYHLGDWYIRPGLSKIKNLYSSFFSTETPKNEIKESKQYITEIKKESQEKKEGTGYFYSFYKKIFNSSEEKNDENSLNKNMN